MEPQKLSAFLFDRWHRSMWRKADILNGDRTADYADIADSWPLISDFCPRTVGFSLRRLSISISLSALNLVSTVTLIGGLVFTGLQVRAANRARHRIDCRGGIDQIARMRRLKQSEIASFTICGLLAVSGIVYAASSAIVVKDVAGKSLTFFSKTNANSRTVVFIFVLPDCPICNSYVPELKRIRDAFPEIEFYRVYADPDMTTSEARQHSNEYDFGFPGLLDPGQQLVRKSGATRTPEAAAFSPEGKLLYRGRIDDRYTDFGKKRDRPGQRDLENALRSILEKQPARWPKAAPIGCFIPTKEKQFGL